ncbi:MAG: S41 family peptidase [Bacteroidales bacterium]|nr:S41 family peptidase [Bacteroidales bacterium]
MKKTAAAIIALILCAANLNAITPLWLRDVKISPDGSTIAFCYKGDIWTVPAKGGTATRLTTLESFESTPVWSPDGKQIAFSSDRFGNYDIFVMSAAGGSATRLTFNSAKELPICFTPDGKNVYFDARIQDPAESAMFPSSSIHELYSVPVSGGKTIQILATPAEKISFSPDGKFFVYQDKKGLENEWRKHHISSDSRDIWRYDIKTGRHTNLTNRPGEDRDPVISSDGKTVYFISEPAATKDGRPVPEGWQSSLNVFSFPIDKTGELTKVSNFKTHPVRFLSMGGDILCYTWDGEIYTQKPGSEPVKVSIELNRDEENFPETITSTSGARYASVSPDGKQIAFSIRGEVFVTSVEYGTTKQITSTTAADYDPVFGKDNRTLVYTSDRDGIKQLYQAKIAREEDPNFPNATLIEESPLFQNLNVDRSDPKFSPDGKELAFIEDRTRLMVANFENGSIRQITDGSTWFDRGDSFSYSWSPDGKWFTLTYVPNGHEPYSDIGIVSARGGEITNITGSGYTSYDPKFTFDGNAIMFKSERFGMRSHASWGSQDDIFMCFLNQDAYDRYRLSKEDYELLKEAEKDAEKKAADNKKDDKKKEDKEEELKPVKVELDGIQDRIVRLTTHSCVIGNYLLSKDGEDLYYLASFEKGYDLWKMNLRKRDTKIVSKGAGSGILRTDGKGETIFLLGSSFSKFDGKEFKPVNFKAQFRVDHEAEREYMFNYVYREEKERFYNENMHGVDWDGYTAAYRRFLPHIDNNYDFAVLLSEWLGELNVSHTGATYYPELKSEATASLGLFYDLRFPGDGLKVTEVLEKGPFDYERYDIKAGDIITHIDGQEITASEDISLLLRGKAGKKTLVSVKGKGDMVVIPVSQSTFNDLLYKRWVKQRAADVEKWSNGRLGYVHLKQMNDASYRDIYSDILGKYNKCDGIVIDTRFNGGGRLHEDIEILFSGEKYLTQVVRGKEACDMPSRRYNKPSIMIQGEANYSNAHGTPWVYRHKNLGKLVGAPVPGTMTSVNWVDLQDQTITFGIPVTGYLTAEGYYLEDNQLEPDIHVLNAPETVVKGEDTQLRAAVEELLKEIDEK